MQGEKPLIKNSKQIALDRDRELALSIIEDGLISALPATALKKIIHPTFLQIGQKRISLKKYRRIYVVAIGKSADLMAKVTNLRTKICGGIVVLPNNTYPVISRKKFTVVLSGHPIPTQESVMAAQKVIAFLKSLRCDDYVIFLISGGASSLISMPAGISLKNKQLVTDLLLKSGANIQEINCVRKHLSQVKGGQLMKQLQCEAISLVMSDVIGDDLSVIGSGITYCDRSTFSDAKKVLIKYGLTQRVPKPVLNRINMGMKGIVSETPKKPKIENYVIATNKDCVDAMKYGAKQLGFTTKIIWPLDGNVECAARQISKYFPIKDRTCLIFGGETTVMVKGKGRGGRNQELVLHLLKRSKTHKEKMVFASLDTDGIDGTTNVAGAIADSTMPTESLDAFLQENDSYCYFKKFGGLIITGPTHTNLMDVGLVLRK